MKRSMTTKKFPTRISKIFPTNITKGLNLCESTGNVNFENEESCKTIKSLANDNFSFETVSKRDVLDLIKKLFGNTATVSNDILVSVLKEYVPTYYKKLTDNFNKFIRTSLHETRNETGLTIQFALKFHFGVR